MVDLLAIFYRSWQGNQSQVPGALQAYGMYREVVRKRRGATAG